MRVRYGKYHIPSVDRAMAVMELLAEHPEGLGLVSIAKTLRVPTNSVQRIAITLVRSGYLHRDEDTKRFTLTRKLLSLAHAAVGGYSLTEVSLDVMRELRDEVKETVLLGVLTDTSGVVLEQVPGSHHFKFIADAGKLLTLNTAAPCKAILAFLPTKERDVILKRVRFKRFNDNTITDKKTFREELRKVRELGYAADRNEELEGVYCIGAPLLNQYGVPVASIWVTGPSNRMSGGMEDSIGQAVKEHAARISRKLGYEFVNGREMENMKKVPSMRP